jgi:two-component system chemotaxis response regulator CheB
MARRDIIVVGASSGGVDALSRMVAAFPADLEASVLIVLHMAPSFPRVLAERLGAAGPLPAAEAVDGETMRPGQIYVAVPDHHLLIQESKLRLTRGPRENHSRPSINALFRSAAYYCGERVIGVVLTGQLDDGTAGLWAIKDRGGLAIVQDPEEAAYPSMPRSALKQIAVDYTLKVAEVGHALRLLSREEVVMTDRSTPASGAIGVENSIAMGASALEAGVLGLGHPTLFTCPDCNGTLLEIKEGPTTRFRCHTGHAYTERALQSRTLMEIEKSLWITLARLEERELLLERVPQPGAAVLTDLERTRSLRRHLRETLGDAALSQSDRDG